MVTDEFSRLWGIALNMAISSGHERLRSTLVNHSNMKERVCRKLGIVSESDINRIIKQFKRRSFSKKAGVIEPRQRGHKHG
jgi:hypothetical protein